MLIMNCPKDRVLFFFKMAPKALNMHSLFEDLNRIGISPSSLRCMQYVSQGYVITFKDPQERVTFSQKSSFVSLPEREVYTVYIHDAPFELPDNALTP